MSCSVRRRDRTATWKALESKSNGAQQRRQHNHNKTTNTRAAPPGKLDLRSLPHALTPWTDALALSRLDAAVDDGWLARVAVCRGLRVLDIDGCSLVRCRWTARTVDSVWLFTPTSSSLYLHPNPSLF